MKTFDTDSHIVLDHGTGGLLSNELVLKTILPALGEAHCGELQDSFVFDGLGFERLAITTDSFVINPPIFGNADIGKIAVCGTVNDLAVAGAEPRYLTLALVLEEGFKISQLTEILTSVKRSALEAGVKIVAGDTKVVKKGEVDKIFINTSGIGLVPAYAPQLTTTNIQPLDDIILTSHLGDHSIHVLSMREGLGFEERVLSDCAPLNHMLSEMLRTYTSFIRCMRDVTRGGLGSILNEIAEEQTLSFTIREPDLPIRKETRMASEMLGISPIYLANEGCACIFADPSKSRDVVALLRRHEYGRNATIIGTVSEANGHRVVLEKSDGRAEVVEHLQGMELPRLC